MTDIAPDRADVFIGGKRIRVQWIGQGNLGDVRRFFADRNDDRPDIVVARRLSPGARDSLSSARVGWVDETGAAEVDIGSIIVSRTGRSPDPVEKPKRWTPAVIAAAEALLCGSKATVSAMQDRTGLSAGSCTNALRALTDFELLAANAKRGRDSARHVSDRGRLLDAYATAVSELPDSLSLQIGVSWRDPIAGLIGVGRKWDAAKVDWAATGAAAAAVMAPFLTSVNSAEVYVHADTVLALESVASEAGLRPIDGGRLTLRPFPTVTARRLAEQTDGLRVCPWPRVYADLRGSGVRGEEAAEHLREVFDAR